MCSLFAVNSIKIFPRPSSFTSYFKGDPKMATKKGAKKKALKDHSPKDGPSDKQVDDPIIIKGGSISITFEGSAKFKKDPGNPKNGFDHQDTSKQLTQVVALRWNAVTSKYELIPGPFAKGKIPLEKDDMVVIYYI
jgi:hypothetical protein